MTVIIEVGADGDLRRRAVAATLSRLSGVDQVVGISETSGSGVADAVARLREEGRLFYDRQTGTACYAPSPRAKEALNDGASDPRWSNRLVKYLSQTVQSVPGAIFSLPIITADGEVEAFITDWSPFPAACAVAVHPSHSLADAIENEADRFTGHYVRHPLTGDLIPVWTGGWVRPEFGTGSVIVNPAHSMVDLEFARQVGLPVRFALSPTAPTTDPDTWPEPPVVKGGQAVRTGVADGKPASEAGMVYLKALLDAKHARNYQDRVLGTLTIGYSATPGASAATVYQDPGQLALTPLASQLFTGPLESDVFVVASMAAIPEVATVRALHIDLYGKDIEPKSFLAVAAGNGLDATETDRSGVLAAISFAAVEDVYALKKPHAEQTERFYSIHEELLAQQTETSSESPGKRARNIYNAIADGRFSSAFSDIYKLQRDFKKDPAGVANGDQHSYFALAYILGGTDLPTDYSVTDALTAFAASRDRCG